MDERLFTRLAALLASGPVVLASVVDTRGATPRKVGSRMLVSDRHAELSVGGGEAEARVIAAARELLARQGPHATLDIDLTGKPSAAGVCGGTMRISLRSWRGADDERCARDLSRRLQAGERVTLSTTELGPDARDEIATPNDRLLIVGAGHCALALHELARHLEFEIWVHDARLECFADGQFADAHRLIGAATELRRALETQRAVYAVLLNRDYPADVAALRVLSARPPAFLSMMGSRKRIAEVLAALPEQRAALANLQAPVGLEIGAETPHEIAVSILAQLIQHRRGSAA